MKRKYGHLIPINFRYNDLATFKFEHLDKDGGHDRLRQMLSRGADLSEVVRRRLERSTLIYALLMGSSASSKTNDRRLPSLSTNRVPS